MWTVLTMLCVVLMDVPTYVRVQVTTNNFSYVETTLSNSLVDGVGLHVMDGVTKLWLFIAVVWFLYS